MRWGVFEAVSPGLSSPAWKSEELEFTAPPANAPARLALTYQRLSGTTRMEGSLSLRGFSLERMP